MIYSDMVPIADNQFVFSDVENDAQLIVEINEMTDNADEEAVEYHFQELAMCNKAEAVEIKSKRKLDKSEYPNIDVKQKLLHFLIKVNSSEMVVYQLIGTQRIIPSKKQDDPRDFVTIYLVIIRLKAYETDLLVSLNIPDKTQAISDGSSDKYQQLLQFNDHILKKALESLTTDEKLLEALIQPSDVEAMQDN